MNQKTLSHHHMNKVSDFGKDKKKNGGQGIYEGISKRGRSNEENMGEKLCIDDKNLQGEGVIILSNPEKDKLVGIISSTKGIDAINYIKTYISENLRLGVKEIAADMGGNMKKITVACFPNSILVIDRFHVMKIVLENLLAVRTKAKTLITKRRLDEEKQAKEDGKNYKGERYMTGEDDEEVARRLIWQLRKRRKDWNKSQERRRVIASQIDELKDTIRSYNHVEKLRKIYDSLINKEEARLFLEAWIIEGKKLGTEIIEISNSTRMIEKRLDNITNYFIHRHSNGYAEGLNSRIQRLISMTRGFANRDYLYYRIMKMFS